MKITIVFHIFISPWLILNTVIAANIGTLLIYGLIGLILYPNIDVFFTLINKQKNQESMSISQVFQNYWTCLKSKLRMDVLSGIIFNMGIMFFLFDFFIVSKNVQLRFMIIPLLIIGSFLLALMMFYLTIPVLDKGSMLPAHKLKLAIFLSWRYPMRTIINFLLIILWFSLGYYAALFNILIGTQLICWLIFKNLVVTHSKMKRLLEP